VAAGALGVAGASAARAVPHSPQNFTAGEFAAPHDGQVTASGDPHSPQNLRPASLVLPHVPHTFSVATCELYSSADRGYAPHVASDVVDAGKDLRPEKAWWLRVPAVLLSPRSVFFALREDDEDDVAARSEPLLLVIWLAGMAAVLATPTAADILDNPEYDTILLAIWTFIAGGLYGFVGYFLIGFGLYFGVRLLGSLGDFRRARQTVGFALVPLAASLLVLLPLRLALYGGDTFRAGGADEGAGEDVLLATQVAFAAWSLALLLIGVRVVHGWSWPRSLGAVGAAAALLAAIFGVFVMI
jgi:hypothetical protein